MTMSGKEVVKLLLDHGWVIDRIHGSHYIMVKGSQTITAEISPAPLTDLKEVFPW